MSPEIPNQPDEPANPPPAQAFPPPPVPRQAKAVDSSPPPWPSAPMDKVSLFALITAIPGFGLVSIPLGIWGVIRTKNHQRRGRTLAVISFVLIGLWAIVGTVVGVMARLSVTSTTDRTAAAPPSGLVAPTHLLAWTDPGRPLITRAVLAIVTTVRMSGAGTQPDSCLRLTPWFWVSWLLICRLPTGAAPVVLAGRAVTS
jgi:hypothetical protein